MRLLLEGDKHTYKMITDGYRLRLSFGKEEKKGLLPGRIEFSILGSPKTSISGSFVASVKGFRTINGKADLTSDAHATLDEVALEYLRKQYPQKEIRIADQGDSVLAAPGSPRTWGYKDVAVAVDGESFRRIRLQFTKQSGEWAVFSELTPQQFPHAHPVYPPQEDEYEELVTSLSAQRGEQEFLSSFPGKEVHDIRISCVYYDPDGFAGAELKYKVEGSAEEQGRHYVMQLKDGLWDVGTYKKAPYSVSPS